MCMLQIPCELDDRLAGLVEAWASGVTWQELLGCKLDEGDLARLLRRTIDLLAQVWFSIMIYSCCRKNCYFWEISEIPFSLFPQMCFSVYYSHNVPECLLSSKHDPDRAIICAL